MYKVLSHWLKNAFYACGCLLAIGEVSSAQVIPDNTVNTQVNQNGNVAEITGGKTQGNNLFHSFQDFSVPTGNEAFFNNAGTISNIFSRVTGGNISNIDGAIRANGSANLFLINPAGIIFGENARLDVGGSFLGSTSNSILFPDDIEFSATDTQINPILTINAPIGLGFRDNPGDITVRAATENGLEVSPENTLAFLGGNVAFEAGKITAPGGNVELGGLSAAGEIRIDVDNNLTFADGVAKANVSLSDRSSVNVRGSNGGSIQIDADNLELSGESQLLAGIESGSGFTDAQAGNISINTNSFVAREESGIRNETLDIGNAGDINIITETLEFSDGSAIVASTFGTGNAGNININATGNVSFDLDFGGVFSTVGVKEDEREANVPGVVGEGGDITIDANSLFLTNGAQLSTKTAGIGNAGNVFINANNTVSLDGKGTILVSNGSFIFNIATAILTQVEGENDDGTRIAGQGNAGNIEVTTARLELTDAEGQTFGPFLLTGNRGGLGNAGNITINASNSVFLGGFESQLGTEIGEKAEGEAGDIAIATGSLSLVESSFMVTQTKGVGDAGNITINASDSVSFSGGTELNAQVVNSAEGNAGDIAITTGSLNSIEESSMITQTRGVGDGGNITINASDSVFFSGTTQLNAQVDEQAEGNAGDIAITTGSLNLIEESFIQAQTRGQGNPGNITIDATGEVSIEGGFENDNNSKINAQTAEGGISQESNEIKITADSLVLDDRALIVTGIQAGGSGEGGGDITINVNSLSLDNRSELTSLVSGTGMAGDVTINATEQISLEGTSKFLSQIRQDNSSDLANVVMGNAGDIVITTSRLSLDNFAQISSNAQVETQGNPGNITIDVDTLEATNGSTIDATTNNDSLGGDIKIDAENIQLIDGGKIVTSNSSTGDAGNITIDVDGDVIIDNANPFLEGNFGEPVLRDLIPETGIFASTGAESTGDGGNINLTVSDRVAIENEGQISVASEGQGNGGTLFVDANSLELDNRASVSAETNSGRGIDIDNINLQIAENIILRNSSEISAQAFDNAQGGNLNIDAEFIIAFPNGSNDIIARAQRGQGGVINIDATLLGIQERSLDPRTNDIDASSSVIGLDGTINIDSPRPIPIQESRNLPTKIVEAEQTIAQVCNTNREAVAKNSFTIKGKGGIPAAPDSPLDSRNIIVGDNQINNSTSAIPEPIETSQGKIRPARGIKVTESGEIILTAYRTNNAGERIIDRPNCS